MAKKSSCSVADARNLLQQAGLRRTTSRVAVLRALADASSPLSHTEMADLLENSGFDRSTIYRCLVDMAEAGLLARLDLGDHTWRFGLLACHENEVSHPHFLCVDCGKASCLRDVKVRISSTKTVDETSLGEVTEVVLKGHCPSCR